MVYPPNTSEVVPGVMPGEKTNLTSEEQNDILDYQTAVSQTAGAFIATAMQGKKAGEIQFFDNTSNIKSNTVNPNPAFAPQGDVSENESSALPIEYVVVCDIEGKKGAYTLNFYVQDAKTRETVAEASRNFASLNETPVEAVAIAKEMDPLIDKTRAFQTKKRDEDNTTAIYAKWELTADKYYLKAGESTKVKLHFFDCDGTPLANREVHLDDPEELPGKFESLTLTTDNDGNASTTFKAGEQPGSVILTVNYRYTSVTHKTAYATRCGPMQTISVDVPYTLSVQFVFEGKSREGDKTTYWVHGTKGFDFKVSKADSCGKWVPINGNTITMAVAECYIKGKTSQPLLYDSPNTFEVPLTITYNLCKKGDLWLHLEKGGPDNAFFKADGHTVGMGPALTAMMAGLFKAHYAAPAPTGSMGMTALDFKFPVPGLQNRDVVKFWDNGSFVNPSLKRNVIMAAMEVHLTNNHGKE